MSETSAAVRRVLVIAYYFPPWGGAGVQRTAKYIKYLPQFGWQPVVLTTWPTAGSLSDPTLAEDLPTSLKVIRTPALLVPRALPWRARNLISRWLLVVDEQLGWYPYAVREAERLVLQERIDALYTTSAPYTSHLIGQRLKRHLGLPWIADFRDPWVDNFSATFPTALHRHIAVRLERTITAVADQVTVVSEPIRQALLARHPDLSPNHVSTITNGYDPADFEGMEPLGREPGRMVIVYSGSFYGRRQIPLHFFQGLLLACEAEPDLRQDVRVTLVGNVGQATMALAESLGLADVVQAAGYRPHGESIAYLLGADVLLLIIGSGPGSEAVFTGKIFEYLAARKPILALAPTGAAADLILSSRAGLVVDPEDAPAIGDQIVDLYHRWKHSELNFTVDQTIVNRYDRRQLTLALAGILDTLSPGTA